jgi:hypothetical protein
VEAARGLRHNRGVKAAVVLTILALSISPFAQQGKVKIEPKPLVGAKGVYRLTVEMVIGDMKAEVSAKVMTVVKSVEKDLVTTIGSWEGLKVLVNGEDLPMLTASDVTVVAKPSGEVVSVGGGVQGSDEARMYLITHFVPPADALAQGEKYKVQMAAVAEKGIPARKYEGTYDAEAEVAGRKGHRFKVKYSEPGPEGMTGDLVFVVMADGTLLRAEGTFANMPVPQVGANATGSYKLEIEK